MSRSSDLQRDLRDVMRKHSILKDTDGIVGVTDGVDYGGLIPEPEVVGMINLTRRHNQWLSAISMATRQRRTGRIKYRYHDGYVVEYVGDDVERQVTSRPATGFVEYVCKKHKAEIVFDMDDLDEFRAAGEANFEQSVMQDFYTQLGNNLADISMNANVSLPDTTRDNRALRSQNGIDLQTDAATVVDANGWPFDQKIFIAMRDKLPFGWREQPGMRFMLNDRVINHWQDTIANRATSLGDLALTSKRLGSEYLDQAVMNPYVRDDKGPDAIAPTSAADNTTYITFNLGTLVTAGNPASVDKGVGRRFLVAHKTTGKQEYATGYKSGTDLLIDTTSLLGQTTVSTTASDYEVRPADQTDLYFGEPKNFNLIMCREMRSYREYNKNTDRIEVVVWLRFAVVVPEPILPGIIKVKNMALPHVRFPWEAAA